MQWHLSLRKPASSASQQPLLPLLPSRPSLAATMRFLYLLLLPLCLLFSQVAPGAGLITGLFRRYPEYQCAKKGGTCNFSPCPLFTRVDGACYSGKAKCCV